MNNKDITFRRIKGRLVPIRLNKTTKERAIGGATIGAGIATSIAGGAIYKKAVIASAKKAFAGFSALDKAFAPKPGAQLSLFDLAKASKYQKAANESFRAATKLSKYSGLVKKFSPLIGESLIAYGAFKVIKTLDKKTKKKLSPELVYGGAAATTLIGHQALKVAKNSFHAGMYGRQGTFEFAKSGVQSLVPKFKDLAVKALKAKF